MWMNWLYPRRKTTVVLSGDVVVPRWLSWLCLLALVLSPVSLALAGLALIALGLSQRYWHNA